MELDIINPTILSPPCQNLRANPTRLKHHSGERAVWGWGSRVLQPSSAPVLMAVSCQRRWTPGGSPGSKVPLGPQGPRQKWLLLPQEFSRLPRS